MAKFPISKTTIKGTWNKYSLIVVGNVVFFILLYFFSYRPNSDENRAAEFLSMAQSNVTNSRLEAALVLYQKVLADYADTRAAKTARGQLPALKTKLHAQAPGIVAAVECEEIEVEELLRKGPGLYMATYLARQIHRYPEERVELEKVIRAYAALAVNEEGVGLADLAKEPALKTPAFQRALFDLKPRCQVESDWFYDNFRVSNENFYTWHNVNISLVVAQGSEQEKASLRVDRLGPGESVELLEFHVQKSAGAVTCAAKIATKEGKTAWKEEI